MTEHRAIAKRELGEVRAIGGDDQRREMRLRAPRVEIRNLWKIARPPAQRDRDRESGDDRRRDHQPDQREDRKSPPPTAIAAIADDDMVHDSIPGKPGPNDS